MEYTEFLTAEQLMEKIKEYSMAADYGLVLTPFFVRVSNDGKNYCLIVMSLKNNPENGMVIPNDVFEVSVADGRLLRKTSAPSLYTQMSMELPEQLPAKRTNRDKKLGVEYKGKILPTLEKIREQIRTNNEVIKEDYAEYLRYALYGFSDELASQLVALSRTSSYETYTDIICTSCGKKIRLSTASRMDGERMQAVCPYCNGLNHFTYQKRLHTMLYRKPYAKIREEENGGTPTVQPTVKAEPLIQNRDAGVMDGGANYSMTTDATVKAEESAQIRKLEAAEVPQSEVNDEIAKIKKETVSEAPVVKAEERTPEQTETVSDISAETAQEVQTSDAASPKTDLTPAATEASPVTGKKDNDTEGASEEGSVSAEELYSRNPEVLRELERRKKEAAERKKLFESLAPASKTIPVEETKKEEEPVIGLSYQREAFKVINQIVMRHSDYPVNHVFGLRGNVGCGMEYSIRSLNDSTVQTLNPDADQKEINRIGRSSTDGFSMPPAESYEEKCGYVIDINESPVLSRELKNFIGKNMRRENTVFFIKGNAAAWEQFQRLESVFCTHITAVIDYHGYKTEELYRIFKSRLTNLGMTVDEPADSTKKTIFGSSEYGNALRAVRLASEMYFKAKIKGKDRISPEEMMKVERSLSSGTDTSKASTPVRADGED